MNIKENYQQYVSRYAAEVATLKRKNTGFITGELLAFGGNVTYDFQPKATSRHSITPFRLTFNVLRNLSLIHI